MDPQRIIRQLSELLQKDIIPGSTLLFFDEIQNTPQAITALRYFYETNARFACCSSRIVA